MRYSLLFVRLSAQPHCQCRLSLLNLTLSSQTPSQDIPKEVLDIAALRGKAVPLLIGHLDDTRPTSATVLFGGYLMDKTVRVPVDFICLNILTSIVERSGKLIFSAAMFRKFSLLALPDNFAQILKFSPLLRR